jgi:hypothetical protein
VNWEAIGAVGEIVGAVAVVVSLLYLAVQIRIQNAQARLAALHEMSGGFREVTAQFANAYISDIFIRANAEFNSISDSESVSLIVLTTNLFRAWEEAFLQARDGQLEAEVWEKLSRDYTTVMGASSFRHIWGLRKQNFTPEFQKYVDSLEFTEYIVR